MRVKLRIARFALFTSLLAAASILCAFACASAEPETVDVGGVRYLIDGGRAHVVEYLSETVTFYKDISGYPPDTDADDYGQQNRNIVKNIIFAEGFVEIPTYFCSDFYSLERVTLPSTMRTIGTGAFYICPSLSSVTLAEGLTAIRSYAFSNCAELEEILLPESLNEIGEYAFGSSGLRDIAFPASLEVIGDRAFMYCSNLETVSIPASVRWIGESAFSNSPELREIAVEPGNQVFQTKSGGLYSIDGESLFQYPSAIEGSLSLPEGTLFIRGDAFANSRLRELAIPEGVTRLPISVGSMKKLERLSLPSTLTEWDYDSFAYSESLAEIDIAPGNPAFKVVDGVAFTRDGAQLILFPRTRAGSYVIPEGVNKITWSAFYSTKLTELALPESMTDFPVGRIQNMPYLERLTLPASLKTIDDGSMYAMPSLTSIDVSPGCEAFRSLDGVVFSADMKTLVRYPPGREGAYIVPEGTLAIADGAFAPTSLSELTIAEGIAALPDYFIQSADQLRALRLPASLQTIGEQTLETSAQALRVEIAPENPRYSSVGGWILEGGELLKYVGRAVGALDIPQGITKIPAQILAYQEYITQIAIPEGVREIEDYAFTNCTMLRRVSLPLTLEVIGHEAFFSCVRLERVSLPPGLKSIGRYAFNNCAALRSIAIPDSVEDIGYNAFTFAGSIWTSGDWDPFEPTPTDLIVRSSERSVGRWAAWAASVLWADAYDADAEPVREARYNPDGTGAIALLTADDAKAAIPLRESPDAGAKAVASFDNGTPVTIDERGAAPSGWEYVTIGPYGGYVRSGELTETEPLTGLAKVLYASLSMAESPPDAITMYEYPSPLSAQSFDAPWSDAEALQVLDNMGTWLKVRWQNSYTGYIPANKLDMFAYNPFVRYYTERDYAIVKNPDTRDRLNLRDRPSRNGRAFGKYFNGTQVLITKEVDDDWFAVTMPDGTKGYMMKQYLERLPGYYERLINKYSGEG